MLTYGDGVSNVDLTALLAFHRAHGKLATVTAVRPPARFGGLVFDGDGVAEFTEKPQIGEGWINGGFMVFEPGVFDYHRRRRHGARSGRARDAGRDKGSWWRIDTTASGSAWTRSATCSCCESLWEEGRRRGRPGNDCESKRFWLDRPTFVTGATGLVGGWLVRRLVALGADVVVPGPRLGARRASSCAPG